MVTLSLAHWATLGRITRAAIIEESSKDYIVSALVRGLPGHRICGGTRCATPSGRG